MTNILEEIFIKPSQEIKINRFLNQDTHLAFAACNGKCKSGTCIVILPSDTEEYVCS